MDVSNYIRSIISVRLYPQLFVGVFTSYLFMVAIVMSNTLFYHMSLRFKFHIVMSATISE